MELSLKNILEQKIDDLISDYPEPGILRTRIERLGKVIPAVNKILDRGTDSEQSILSALLTLGEAPVDEAVRYPHLASMFFISGWIETPFANNPAPRTDLARFKRHAWLKILLRDRCGLAPLEETLSDLTLLADNVTSAALEIAAPSNPGIALWAMGKWGGGELNVSSDVDPVFFREESLTSEEADRIIREWLLLLMPQGEPEIYPVDLRLRPEGVSGPLAISYKAAEKYFFQRAAPWERIAYLRARRVTGAEPDWFSEMLDAFLFSSSANPRKRINEVAQMLGSIRKGAKPRDIKRDRGGIRDVEFLVASIQLSSGYELKDLRSGTVLDMLKIIGNEGIIKQDDIESLEKGYRFLRKVENILQAENDRADFLVPAPANNRHGQLAWKMGMKHDEFERNFINIREKIAGIVDKEFGGDPVQISVSQQFIDPQMDEIISAEAKNGAQTSWLSNTRIQAVIRRLSGKWGSAINLIDTSEINALPDFVIEEVFGRLESAVASYGGPATWLSVFRDDPSALKAATRILIYGKRLCSEAMNRPYLWEKIGLNTDSDPAPESENSDILNNWLGDRLFYLGSNFISGSIDTEEFAMKWCDGIDKVIVLLSQSFSIDPSKESIGVKADKNENLPGIAVIALGKWGGREVIPDADLDFLFITEDTDAGTLSKLQSIGTRWMQKASLNGRLLLDARLRPEGSGAPLVITLKRLEEYLTSRAQAWEKIALARARVIRGDTGIGYKALKIIRAFTTVPPGLSEWKIIHNARKRAAEKSRTRPSIIGIKKARGGMMDYEFAATFAGWKLGIGDDNWWNKSLAERMRILERAIEGSDWRDARDFYLTLRKWEILQLLAGERRQGKLVITGEGAEKTEFYLAKQIGKIREEWKSISTKAINLYKEYYGSE
ncbi:MAG: hypothetical protein P9L92_10790 [Candidatus Electryonea clarkiae]|nr:hypothetical protein [Candidatus Electryonea clarkiae]MDP8287121.1 hypothetical protein [Candidatus Electryonea clarkiae]